MRVCAGGREIKEGAAVAAAIDGKHFEIVRFFSKGMLLDVPRRMEKFFPQSACDAIKRKLRL